MVWAIVTFDSGFRVIARWEGKCWYYYNQLKYEFDLEFEVKQTPV
jgi:hypothetical protein